MRCFGVERSGREFFSFSVFVFMLLGCLCLVVGLVCSFVWCCSLGYVVC